MDSDRTQARKNWRIVHLLSQRGQGVVDLNPLNQRQSSEESADVLLGYSYLGRCDKRLELLGTLEKIIQIVNMERGPDLQVFQIRASAQKL